MSAHLASAQWESVQAFQEMLADPACHEHMSAAREIAGAEPFRYEVASVHHS
ncbi:hypothetical protein ACWEV3_38210 [Saccharopolyspora sp. NPDC003752]